MDSSSPPFPSNLKRSAEASEPPPLDEPADNSAETTGRHKVLIRPAFQHEAKDRIDTLEKENLALKEKLAGSTASLRGLQATNLEHGEAFKVFEQERNGLLASIQDADSAIAAWANRTADLEEAVNVKSRTEAELRARTKTLEEDNSRLTGEAITHQKQMATIREENERNATHIEELEAEKMLVEQTETDTTAKIIRLEKELEDSLTTADTAVRHLFFPEFLTECLLSNQRRHCSELSQERNKLQRLLDEETTTAAQEKARNVTLIESKSDLKKELAELKGELQKTQERMKDVEVLNSNLTKEMDTMRGDLARPQIPEAHLPEKPKDLVPDAEVHRECREDISKLETMLAQARERMGSMEKKIHQHENQSKWTLDYVAKLNIKLAQAEKGPDADMSDPTNSASSSSGAQNPTTIDPSGPSTSHSQREPANHSGSSPNAPAHTSPHNTQSNPQSSTPDPGSRSKGKPRRKPKMVPRRQRKTVRPWCQRNALKAFRKYVHRKLGIESDKQIDKLVKYQAPPEALAAFEAGGPQPAPHPTTKLYSLDMAGDDVVYSSWNEAVGERLILGFLQTYEPEEEIEEASAENDSDDDDKRVDEQFLKPLWRGRLEGIRRALVDVARTLVDPEYMNDLSKTARRLTHRNQLFERRLHSAQLAWSASVRNQLAVLFNVLSGLAMSSDDEIGRERRKKTCRVIRKDWRHEVLINLLKWLDYHTDYQNLTASGVSSGPAPHPRLRAAAEPATQSSSPVIKGLPRNLYSPVWLATLPNVQVRELNLQEPIPLPVEVFELQTNVRFEANECDNDEFWRPQKGGL
ncbi:hypothetical protein C8R46DRAFT_1212446 [Mycena filopes]|nr:hypothetical protein C8R46DRAFT_1212446 [Mycena filopes]